jgi:hypothetical protein
MSGYLLVAQLIALDDQKIWSGASLIQQKGATVVVAPFCLFLGETSIQGFLPESPSSIDSLQKCFIRSDSKIQSLQISCTFLLSIGLKQAWCIRHLTRS